MSKEKSTEITSQAIPTKSPEGRHPVQLPDMIGVNPETGHLVDEIVAQTRQTLKNIEAVLKTSETGLQDIIAVVVAMTDLKNDYRGMIAACVESFGKHRPLMATVGVNELPFGARVEITATAWNEARDAIKTGFQAWFKTVFVAEFVNIEKMADFETAYEVPLDITEMPCGCKRGQGDTTVWTIQSEPFDEFVKYINSQVMVHSDCGKTIGEIPTPWVHDLR